MIGGADRATNELKKDNDVGSLWLVQAATSSMGGTSGDRLEPWSTTREFLFDGSIPLLLRQDS